MISKFKTKLVSNIDAESFYKEAKKLIDSMLADTRVAKNKLIEKISKIENDIAKEQDKWILDSSEENSKKVVNNLMRLKKRVNELSKLS